MEKRTVGIIRNPCSGRGAWQGKWPALGAQLQSQLGDRLVAIEVTTAPGSARTQAAELALQGIEIIVAAGGDGTVNEVMKGILGTNSILAILPLGTGNDLARTLGVGPDVRDAINALVAGQTQRIDVGKWTSEPQTGHFVNVAGCGFDAAVAERANRGIRNLRGTAAYLAAILLTLRDYRPTSLTIRVDGQEIQQRALLCALANAKSYGGGMKVAPLADVTDGLLDLVLIGDFKPLEFLFALPRVLNGTHLKHPKVQTQTFRHLEITSNPPVPFLVDGELIPGGKITIEAIPAALTVVVGNQFSKPK